MGPGITEVCEVMTCVCRFLVHHSCNMRKVGWPTSWFAPADHHCPFFTLRSVPVWTLYKWSIWLLSSLHGLYVHPQLITPNLPIISSSSDFKGHQRNFPSSSSMFLLQGSDPRTYFLSFLLVPCEVYSSHYRESPTVGGESLAHWAVFCTETLQESGATGYKEMDTGSAFYLTVSWLMFSVNDEWVCPDL